MLLDPLHVVVADRLVDGERRWQVLGLASKAIGSILFLLVAHTVREDLECGRFTEVVRVISARRATAEEKKSYEDENG